MKKKKLKLEKTTITKLNSGLEVIKGGGTVDTLTTIFTVFCGPWFTDTPFDCELRCDNAGQETV